MKCAVHSLSELLPSTSPGKVCPIVGGNLHVGKLGAFVKHDAKERLVFARGSFLCNPLRFLYGSPTPRRTEFPHFVRQAESSAACCTPLSPITIPPRKDFLRGFIRAPRLIQSPTKWIMANCYVRRPPPNQSRLGLRTGFCAQVGISGGVRGKNYLQGIFQILEKKPSSVFLRPKVPFPLPQRPKKGILA